LVLAGSWSAVFAFQRPLKIILETLFGLGTKGLHEMVALSARQKTELSLAAVLAPLGEINLAAPFDSAVYAMDASPSHGAVCSTAVGEYVARTLWQTAERRGGYTRLETRARSALRSMGRLPPEDELG